MVHCWLGSNPTDSAQPTNCTGPVEATWPRVGRRIKIRRLLFVVFLPSRSRSRQRRHGQRSSWGLQRPVASSSSPTVGRIKCPTCHRPRSRNRHLLPSPRTVAMAAGIRGGLPCVARSPRLYKPPAFAPSSLSLYPSSTQHPLLAESSLAPQHRSRHCGPRSFSVKAVTSGPPAPILAPSSSLLLSGA